MPFDIGIDLGGTYVKMGLVDRQGHVIARQMLPTKARSGPIPALERVATAVTELKRGRRVGSIGIGIAGLVDHINGIVRVPPNLPGWNGTPVKEILGRLTGIPVFCANDVNAVVLGEWLHGAGTGRRDLLCVTLGTGVGGGIISGGRLLAGAQKGARLNTATRMLNLAALCCAAFAATAGASSGTWERHTSWTGHASASAPR